MPEYIVRSVTLLTRTDDVEYFDYVRGILCDPVAVKVKVADLLSNLSDDPSPDQSRKYARALLIVLGEDV